MKNLIDYSKDILSQYDPEFVDLVKEYKEEVDNTDVYDFRHGDFELVSEEEKAEYLNGIIATYMDIWISKGDEEDFENHDWRYDREDFEFVYKTILDQGEGNHG